MASAPNPLTSAWQAESLLAVWFSLSFLLLSVALAFHHLTRLKKVQFNTVVARILSSTVAVSALVLSGVALLTYRSRTLLMLPAASQLVPHEGAISAALSLVCGCLLLAQAVVAGDLLLSRG